MSNTITVGFRAANAPLNKGLADSQRRLQDFDKNARHASLGLGTLVKGFLATAAVAKTVRFFAGTVTEASQAQQSIGATETVFGRYSKSVIRDSSAAATAVGLSGDEYRNNANLIGSLFRNQGVATDQLAGKTKTMITRASDLAATFGGSTSTAVEALGSAFKGEFDPLEKYGISIKQSTVNAEALRVAHVKSTAEFNKLTLAQQTAAKQQATSNLITKQSAASAGAFAKESGTLANVQQKMSAQWTNLKATLGTALLPVLTAAGTTINKYLLPPMQRLAEKWAPLLGAKLAALATGAGPQLTKWLSDVGPRLSGLGKGDSGTNLSSIATSLQAMGGQLADAAKKLPSFNDLLSVSSTVLAFAAKHTGLLAAALPFLAVAYAGVKAAQLAANVAAVVSIPTKIAEVVVNRQLVASNRELIASRTGLTTATVTGTGAENVGLLTRARMLVVGVAQRAATIAMAAATGIATGAQWLLNAALTANPIGLVVVAIAGLVAGLVIAYQKSETFRAVVNKTFTFLKNIVIGTVNTVVGFVRSHWKLLLGILTGPIGAAVILIAGHWSKITGGVSAMYGAVRDKLSSLVGFVKGIPGKIKSALGDAKTMLKEIGGQIIDGLVQGIKDAAHKVTDVVGDVAGKVKDGFKGALSIFSPSRVTRELGRYVSEGLALGIRLGTPGVLSAVKRQGVDTKKEYAKQIKDISKQLAAASKARLTALKAQRNEYASGVASSAKGFAGLSNLQLGDNQTLTGGTVKQFLVDRLAQIKNFNNKLAALKKKGLGKDLYDQIVQMGVDGGSTYADALAKETPASLKALNSLQSQVSTASGALGKSTSKAMYQSGIDAAAGFDKGLRTYLAKIAKSGTGIAKSLVAALKKALGIKSPSRVLAGIGQQSIKGLQLGLDTRAIHAQGVQLANSLQSGFGTPALRPALSSNALRSNGRSTQPVVVHINGNIVGSNEVDVARWIKNAIRAGEAMGVR